jgi:cytoskeletal protein RodZ
MVSVGELLNKERLRKNITLKQVEKEIRIREKLLQAVEQNNWAEFSSKIYITGIIRNYAKYLGLDPNKMLIFFRRDYEKKEDIRFKKRVSQSYLHPQTKRLVYGALIFVFLLFFLYFLFQVKSYLSPPLVTIISPTTTHFHSVESVDIVGKTDKDANITILGEKVYPNNDGVFQYELPLKAARNNVVIEVTGANGKTTVIKKEFIRD